MFAQNRDSLFTRNHLTPVRWVLALSVMLGHAYFTATGFEPVRVHSWSASYLAVNGFFILSGLLIAKSLNLGKSKSRFAMARLLRIIPGLLLILFSYFLFFGPLFTAGYGQTVHDGDFITYTLRVLFLGDPESTPGTIFSENKLQAFNGSLWTIRFEIIAYFLTAALIWLRLVRGPVTAALLFIALTLADLVAPAFTQSAGVNSGLRLMSAFSLGLLLWYTPELRRPGWLYTGLLLVLFLAFGWTPVGEVLANLALAALILKFGLPIQPLKYADKLPDYSYGIYLWHYPIMQAVLVYVPGIQPIQLFLVAMPFTLLVSMISWSFIERPALKLKEWKIPFSRPQWVRESDAK